MQLEESLTQGAKAMGLALEPGCAQQLVAYVHLLERWAGTHNLTAVRDPQEMIGRHLLDSLAVLPYLRGPQVIDVGTGAGLPGIPLACASPDLQFTLLDSNRKKLAFVRQAVHALSLRNVAVVAARVEDFRSERKFATLVSRAFASIPDMLAACGHLAGPDTRILAMKGVLPREELAHMPPSFQVIDVIALEIPGLDAERHLVIITPRRKE
ncbi:MAG: hypothetical protein AMJ84_08770 [Acidithiobacillales bacterium SM23_46]|nr:MAG: hypothetical protein AMJ84_08770 [Acidithiobacillales bacterium SM23_46]